MQRAGDVFFTKTTVIGGATFTLLAAVTGKNMVVDRNAAMCGCRGCGRCVVFVVNMVLAVTLTVSTTTMAVVSAMVMVVAVVVVLPISIDNESGAMVLAM